MRHSKLTARRVMLLSAAIVLTACTNLPSQHPVPPADLGSIMLVPPQPVTYVGHVEAVNRDPGRKAAKGAGTGAAAGATATLAGPCLLFLALPGGWPICAGTMAAMAGVGAAGGAVVGAAVEGPADDPEIAVYLNQRLDELADALPAQLARQTLEATGAGPEPTRLVTADGTSETDTRLELSIDELSLVRKTPRSRQIRLVMRVSAGFVDTDTGALRHRLVEIQQSGTHSFNDWNRDSQSRLGAELDRLAGRVAQEIAANLRKLPQSG